MRTRLYVGGGGRPRARRATDLILLAVAAGALLTLVQASEPSPEFEKALVSLAQSIPSFLDVFWRVLTGVPVTWVAVLIGGAALRRRLDVLRDLFVSIVGAIVLGLAMDEVFDETSPGVWTGFADVSPPASPVAMRMAILAAVTVVASPHIARPFRRISRWIIGLAAVSLVMLGATTPLGALIGVLCGTISAAGTHLLFGSSGGQPTLEEVRSGLAKLDVKVTSLSEARRQQAGVFQVDAVGLEGESLLIKVYGRDAWDAQLLSRAWRGLWYHDVGTLTLTRLQQAEHEAFVTLLAARNGVPVDDVVRAGRTVDNDAFLVLSQRGEPVRLSQQEIDSDLIGSLWSALKALGDAVMAHGDIAPSRLRRDGETIVISDLSTAVVSPSGDQRRSDLAQALVTSAMLSDPGTAIAVAEERLGSEGLREVLPYLQVAALGRDLRSELAATDLELDDLRTLAAAAAEVDEPELAKLRRASVGTLVRAALLLAGAWILISAVAGIDFQELQAALSGASTGLLVVALLLGQTPRFAQAEATRGACPRPIAYGPVVLLQFAITFINLVVPSTAARVGVNVRFFQRQGIPPASAVSIGMIDGLGGFVVQVLVLGSVFIFGLGDLEIDLGEIEREGLVDLLRLLATIAVVVVAAGVIALLIPKLRRAAFERVRPWWAEARETVASLRSPSKLLRVLGGNLASELLFTMTMGVVLAAFGTWLPLGTLLVINMCVSLFAGLMPVPGGIGVTEGALVLGLTTAGIDETTALAATIAYRACTFYLPPIWGSFAFRRLERTGFL